MTSRAKLGLITLLLAAAFAAGAFAFLSGSRSVGHGLPGRWLVLGKASNCRAWASKSVDLADPIGEIGTPEELSKALAKMGARGVLLQRDERSSNTLAEPAWVRQMRSAHAVSGFTGERMSTRCAAYAAERDKAVLSKQETEVLEKVMRGIFAGQQPPQLASFPSGMRRKQEVELLVILRLDGELRMWRSARRSSLASAALTVGAAIRDRWRSRRAFMQEDLADVADRLTIEMWRAEDAGTLVVENLGQVAELVPPNFGIGIEHHGGWSYRLPEVLVRDPRAVTEDMLKEVEVRASQLGPTPPRLYRMRLARLDQP